MTEYFIRRALLAIPTFFISTFIVFLIVQLAPGGPIEQELNRIRQQTQGETGGGGGLGVGNEIPERAIEEIKRFYHFHEPLPVRYLIWLGMWQRNADDIAVELDRAKNIGDGVRALVKRDNGGYRVLDARNPSRELPDWQVEEVINEKDSSMSLRLVRKEFSGIITLDFGNSYEYREPVIDLIKDRFPVSFQFGLIGFILAYTVCIYIGILKALNHGSIFDFGSSVIVFIGYSIPGWALGAVLLVIMGGGSFWDVFPLGGFQSESYADMGFWEKVYDRAWHFVLPTIAYTISSFAVLTMLTKNSLLENLSQDYIRTAFAKGLRERRVIWMHALRNSIIPIAARIGSIIGFFLASSYLIELVFNIEGIGKLSFMAILSRDYTVVFAFATITVVLLVLGQMLSDLALAFVNPRIRFK